MKAALQSYKLFQKVNGIVYVLLWLMGILVYSMKPAKCSTDHLAAINLQQALILLFLVGVPGILWWSNRRFKLIRQSGDKERLQAVYVQIIWIRLLVFAGLTLLAGLVYWLTLMQGALMLYFILLVLFLFIWPTQARLDEETEL
jgi:hypothetical protein